MTTSDHVLGVERPRLNKTLVVVSLLILAFVAYRAWPLYSLANLAQAVETRNVPVVISHIDVPAVRQSIIFQVLDDHLKQRVRNPIQRSIVAGVAGAVVDPLVADIVSPEALVDFLNGGWPSALPDRPSGISVVNRGNLGSAWRTYMNANFGIRRLEIEVPESLPQNRRFGLEFRLISWSWKLVSIKLPDEQRKHLAELVAKRRAVSQPQPN
jgi:hypothetical protein